MSTPTTHRQHSRGSLRYGTDLTDGEWAVVAPLLPKQELALPGHIEARRQSETPSTAWVHDRWDELGEKPSDDGLPHGG